MTRSELRGASRLNPVFEALDDDTYERVLRDSRLLTVRSGEFVFQRGDRACRFFVVLTGCVNLVLHSRVGDEKVIDTLRPGRSFAETLMFEDEPVYPMAAVAAEDAIVLAVANDAYRSALAGSASACLRMLGDMSRRVHALVREVESQALVDARTRLVRHVLELAGPMPFPSQAPVEVMLREPKRCIAARLGIAPETLSRTFRSLHEEGLMAVSGRTIRIDDLDRLRAAA
jgi:CRP/FNR family transcriptional regulator, dissimilatory nitrate respiration regulator